jgi:hypothetical protein
VQRARTHARRPAPSSTTATGDGGAASLFPLASPSRTGELRQAELELRSSRSLPDWKLEGQTRLGSSWRLSSSRAPEPARARLVDSPGIGFSIITALRVCAAASAPLLPPSNRSPQPFSLLGSRGGSRTD